MFFFKNKKIYIIHSTHCISCINLRLKILSLKDHTQFEFIEFEKLPPSVKMNILSVPMIYIRRDKIIPLSIENFFKYINKILTDEKL